MDNIKKAIECPNCHEILDTPVLLPCCDSVCKKHTESVASIRCGSCSKEHKVSPEGFPVNKNLETLIKSEIDKLDFGHVHSEAIRSCHALDEYLKEVEAVLSSPLKPTRDRIADLKKIVTRKGEDLKIKIDKEVMDLFNLLDEYDKRSQRYLSTDEYSKESNKLDKSVKAAQSELIDWKDTLNKIKLDELKWRNIVNESNAKKSSVRVDLENLKNRFFFINYDEIESRVKFFEQIDITSNFKYTGPTSNSTPSFTPNHTPSHTPSQTPNTTQRLSQGIAIIRKPSVDQSRVSPLIIPNSLLEPPRIYLDSKIIVDELPVRLEALLKEVHMNRQKWGLCYRGSRDGFSAKSFHEKCDETPDTLTIVKTTSDCIFGGYSRAEWSSNECYKFEKGAFVFSLSNKLNKPMVFSQIAGDQKTIHCDPNFGPCFGSGPDFRISDACDSNENSLSCLGCSFTNDDLKKTPDLASMILADGEVFKVSEIEVFNRKRVAYKTQVY